MFGTLDERSRDRWGAFARVAREALLDAWALVQPIECLGCGLQDRALCDACRVALSAPRATAVACDASPHFPVVAAADYDGEVRTAIIALKSHGRLDAARALAGTVRHAVAAALDAVPDDRVALRLAWVPSTARAMRKRGYDPVAELLRAARLPRWRVLVARGASEQKRLGRSDRMRITEGAERFRARGRIAGEAFILVDDVATTGATLVAAADSIEAAGGEVAAAVVVAAPDLDRRRRAPALPRSGGAIETIRARSADAERIDIRLPGNIS